MSIRVLLVDDHKILASGIREHFASVPDIEVVAAAYSAWEAIDLAPRLAPDVVLMDIGLPDLNGIECTKLLLKAQPELRVIGLSTYLEVSVVKKLLHAGAIGYLSKANEIDQLEEAIRSVAKGERFLGEEVTRALMADFQNLQAPETPGIMPKLTQREQEVLTLIAREATTQEIADQLHISVNTVESHRKNLISKFGVRNSVGLVRKAIEWGLLPD